MTDHDVFRGWSASYVLGALSATDRLAFEEHLGSCDVCRDEVSRFAPLPGLLARAGDGALQPLPATVVEKAVLTARSDWVRLERSRRRWRWLAIAAAVVAVVVAVQAALPPAGQPGIAWDARSESDATGTITLDHRAWGTALHLDLFDLPQQDGYVAWVVDRSGNRQQVATWGPTETGRAILDSASSFHIEEVAMVMVTSEETGDDLLIATG